MDSLGVLWLRTPTQNSLWDSNGSPTSFFEDPAQIVPLFHPLCIGLKITKEECGSLRLLVQLEGNAGLGEENGAFPGAVS